MNKYGKAFQNHARIALGNNPFEPMVMLRNHIPAHDLAIEADDLAGDAYSSSHYVEQIGLV